MAISRPPSLNARPICSRMAFLARNLAAELGDPSPGWALRDLRKTEPRSLTDARLAPESKAGRIPAAVALSRKVCYI
ncbi:hypothetical protein MY10362_005615 [Beauveria mimosiformis]